jgi:competence protein ComGC
MSNTIRNTIILSVLLVFIITGFLIIRSSILNKTEELDRINTATQATIFELEKQISNIDSLKAEYEFQKQLQAQQSKLIVGEDNTGITYRYLLRMMSWMNRTFPFDFSVSTAPQKDVAYHEYVIGGRTNYLDLIHMVNNIEHQRAVLTIEDLAINADTAARSDSISFSMVLRTHFQDGGPDMASLSAKEIPRPYTGNQAFNARIYETLPKVAIDPELIDITEASLIGMAENRIYLKSGQGIIKSLALGDRVAWGYLYGIDYNAGKAVFRLNKYGIEETHFLYTNDK